MPPAGTISITLAPDTLREVHESVEAGDYASASDVLHDAIRLWQRQRRDDAERLDAIRARIRRSLDDPRPSLSAEEVRQHMETVFAKAQEEAAKRA